MKTVFMGTPDFAVPALESLLAHHEVVLVVTQPDKPSGRKKRLTAPPVKVVAEKAGIEVLQAKSAKTPEFLHAMKESGAEIAIVVAYGKILPLEVLQAFPRGCINIHGSLLPKYRGAAPIQRAVMAGEKQTGVSIMQLDEGMDTGPVFHVEKIAISETDTAGTIYEKLAPLGSSAMLKVLEGLEAEVMVASPQNHQEASHAAMLKKHDGLLDWNQEAVRVAALIRGLDPWPGAYVPAAGGNLKLFGATVREGQASPGTILSYDKNGIIVACESGAVCIVDVQAPGKKRMAAHAYANGRRLEIGSLISESPHE